MTRSFLARGINFQSDGKWVTGCAFDDPDQPTFKIGRKLMTEPVYNGREFIALASLALSARTICSALAETSEEVQCLKYDTEKEPLPPAALKRFHLCDSLMRPFTVPFETEPGKIRFTPPSDQPFRISVPLSAPCSLDHYRQRRQTPARNRARSGQPMFDRAISGSGEICQLGRRQPGRSHDLA